MPAAQITMPRISHPGAERVPAWHSVSERSETSAARAGLVSIILPCFGQLEHTRLCVPRLLHSSREPFELVFIDAGSLDGTKEYLEGLAAAASVRVEVVSGTADLDLA